MAVIENKELGRMIVGLRHHLVAEQEMFEAGLIDIPEEETEVEEARLVEQNETNFPMKAARRIKQRPKIDLSSPTE